MANTIRIKRRANGGGSGAPSSLANAELAFNEQTNVLYYGTGTGGANGTATSVIAIGGSGAFATLDSPALTGTPTAPTPAENDNSTKIATTAYVQTEIANFQTGTVSSVALSLPTSIFDVSGSPVTTTGTLTATLDTQTANYVWAGPTTGSAAAPTFRALVSGDIPDLSGTYLTTTSAASTYLSQSSASSTYLTQTSAASTYQPLDATLSSISNLGTAANKIIYTTAADTWAESAVTTFGLSLIDDADASAARTTLGLGTMAVETAANYLTTSAASSTYQPLDATLTALAGATTGANTLSYWTGTDTLGSTTLTSFARGLLDDTSASDARATLNLGTIATEAAADYLTVSTASSTYLTQTNAASTYLTQSSASSTYLPLSGGTISGSLTVSTNLTVTGDLTVNGTTTTLNSTTLTVDDKNIELGSVASPTDTTANGGGITLKGATDKEINWYSATGAWTSSEDWNLASGKVFKINGTEVLSATSLGSGIVIDGGTF